jgi:hypothetical protein
MPLQNRVAPDGSLHAVPERGTMLGNRGGKFHRDDQTLGKRRWASRHWICCELHYKDMRHEPMGQGYTSLFFLDEVTALAAGHRPCFFCRRAEAKAFVALSGVGTLRLDELLHLERIHHAVIPAFAGVTIGGCADGLIFTDGSYFFAKRGAHLLRWSFAGYTEAVPLNPSMRMKLLTPPAIAAILRAGYKPRWHPSAKKIGTTHETSSLWPEGQGKTWHCRQGWQDQKSGQDRQRH